MLLNSYHSRDIRSECILNQWLNGLLFDVINNGSHKHITRMSQHIVGLCRISRKGYLVAS